MTADLLTPDTDLFVFAELVGVDELPCDWVDPDCERVAAWSLRCGGCSLVTLMCHEHKAVADVATRKMRQPCCTKCGHRYPTPLPLLPL